MTTARSSALPGPATAFRFSTVAGGTPGQDGQNGAPGAPAFTTVTTNFTQPAVSSTVSVTVGSTAWMGVGAPIFIETGGAYVVSAVTDATHVVLQNAGGTGNASPSSTITSGHIVSPGGAAGPGASVTGSGLVTASGAGHPDPAALALGNEGQALFTHSGSATWVGSAPYFNVKSYGAIGDGSTDDRTAFVNADAAAAGSPIVVPPGTYKIGSNTPLTSPLYIQPGAVLKPSSGVTVTLDRTPFAIPGKQIFDTSAGGHIIFQNASQVYASWWETPVVGVNNRSQSLASLQEAVNSAGYLSGSSDKSNTPRVLLETTLYQSPNSNAWLNIPYNGVALVGPNVSPSGGNTPSIGASIILNTDSDASTVVAPLISGSGGNAFCPVTNRWIDCADASGGLHQALHQINGLTEFSVEFEFKLNTTGATLYTILQSFGSFGNTALGPSRPLFDGVVSAFNVAYGNAGAGSLNFSVQMSDGFHSHGTPGATLTNGHTYYVHAFVDGANNHIGMYVYDRTASTVAYNNTSGIGALATMIHSVQERLLIFGDDAAIPGRSVNTSSVIDNIRVSKILRARSAPGSRFSMDSNTLMLFTGNTLSNTWANGNIFTQWNIKNCVSDDDQLPSLTEGNGSAFCHFENFTCNNFVAKDSEHVSCTAIATNRFKLTACQFCYAERCNFGRSYVGGSAHVELSDATLVEFNACRCDSGDGSWTAILIMGADLYASGSILCQPGSLYGIIAVSHFGFVNTLNSDAPNTKLVCDDFLIDSEGGKGTNLLAGAWLYNTDHVRLGMTADLSQAPNHPFAVICSSTRETELYIQDFAPAGQQYMVHSDPSTPPLIPVNVSQAVFVTSTIPITDDSSRVLYKGQSSPAYTAAVASTQNLAIAGATVVHLTASGAVSLTGANVPLGYPTSYVTTLVNTSSSNITLKNNSGSAPTHGAFLTGTGSDVVLGPNASVTITYDSAAQAWYVGSVSTGSSGTPFRNWAVTPNGGSTLADLTAPTDVLVAVADLTASASGLLLVSGYYSFVDSGGDTVGIRVRLWDAMTAITGGTPDGTNFTKNPTSITASSNTIEGDAFVTFAADTASENMIPFSMPIQVTPGHRVGISFSANSNSGNNLTGQRFFASVKEEP